MTTAETFRSYGSRIVDVQTESGWSLEVRQSGRAYHAMVSNPDDTPRFIALYCTSAAAAIEVVTNCVAMIEDLSATATALKYEGLAEVRS